MAQFEYCLDYFTIYNGYTDGVVEATCDNPSRGNRVLNRDSRFNPSDIVTSDELLKR